jgi:hypothetical protein
MSSFVPILKSAINVSLQSPSPPVIRFRGVFKGEEYKTGFGDLDLCLHWVYYLNLYSLQRTSIDNQDVAWIQTVSFTLS